MDAARWRRGRLRSGRMDAYWVIKLREELHAAHYATALLCAPCAKQLRRHAAIAEVMMDDVVVESTEMCGYCRHRKHCTLFKV